MVFEELISVLGSAGMFALYLPFLLIFAIFYALLTKTEIFGDPEKGGVKRVNVLVAFVASLYVAVFSPFAEPVGVFFSQILVTTGVALVSILVFILVVGLLVSPWWREISKVEHAGTALKILAPIGIIIGGLIVFGSYFSALQVGLPGVVHTMPTFTETDIAFLAIIILTLIILFWLVTGKVEKGKGRAAELVWK